MNIPLYSIKNWDSIFENHESRKLKNLTWIPVPNKWDGLGFVRLRKHKRFAEILGGWLLILQIASKSTPRGVLCRENIPLSPDDMGDITGVPESIFRLTLDVLSSEEMGICWINREPAFENEANHIKSPDTPGESPATPPPNGTEQNRTEYLPPISPKGDGLFEQLKSGISEIYKRKPTTIWDEKENKKLKKISQRPDAIAEFEILRRFYVDLGYPYARKDIITFLNNWTGELDKAKQPFTKDSKGYAVGQKYHEDTPSPLEVAK